MVKRAVYCMNLKDNRDVPNHDKELKFRLCLEKSMIAIGWGVPKIVNTWEEYNKIAEHQHSNDRGYHIARNNFQKIKKGDLVWVKNPVSGERYLVEIKDEYPGIYHSLKEFDTCAYRKGDFHPVNKKQISNELRESRLKAIATLERMHEDNRCDTYAATLRLFESIQAQANR